MPSVETVNGPVDVEDLGLTLIHEHFCSIDEATKFQFPHLYDDAEETERLPWITFTRLSACLVDETEEMGFPPFSGDGRYLEVLYVGEMEKILGSRDDDSQNSFTARMLLLLESQPIYRQDVHSDLLERIVGFYYRDFEDHADGFLPTFLTNDILRFWRTLTLNYEHHRIKILTDKALTKQELVLRKADSALKNYKLKVSRLSTCFSMVAHLCTCAAPVTADTVLELCRMTPSDRFGALRDAHLGAVGLLDEIASFYEGFLENVQHPEQELLERFADERARKQALADAKRYGELIYALLRDNADDERMRSLVV